MNRIIKLPSVEGGNFTANNNRVSFRLPGGMIYKLDNGYVNLYTLVNTTEPVASAAKVGVHNFRMTYNGEQNYILDNIAFVKNANIRSRRVGYLEDIRQVGKLNAHLKQYEENSEEQEGRRYDETGQIYQKTQLKENIFREFVKEGTEKSRELRTPIRIPLKKLFRGVATLPYLPTDKLGDVDINLELDLGKIDISEGHLVPVDTANYDCADLAAAEATRNVLTTVVTNVTSGNPQTFDTIEYSPFWVGQKIDITYTGGTNPSVYRIITGIVYNNDKTVTITFDEDLEAGDLTAVKVTPYILPTANYSIVYDYAEIIVEELAQAPEKLPDVLDYVTFTTEEHSTGGDVNRYQKIFQCEPNAVNMFVLFNTATSPFLSHLTGATGVNDGAYRISVNNDPVTNRDVEFHSPVHYDLVNKTFLNAGLSLHNLNEKALAETANKFNERHETGGATPKAKKLQVIMNPLPLTEMDKQVQVNVEFTGAKTFNQMTLFKQVIKQIQL